MIYYISLYDFIMLAINSQVSAELCDMAPHYGCSISVISKNGYPPSKTGRFSVNLYPIVIHILHPICINLLELNTKVFIFSFSRTRVL